jgi:hypothetical protein
MFLFLTRAPVAGTLETVQSRFAARSISALATSGAPFCPADATATRLRKPFYRRIGYGAWLGMAGFQEFTASDRTTSERGAEDHSMRPARTFFKRR